MIRDVQRETARYYGVTLGELIAPDGPGIRERRFARPRQVAMCLSHRLTGRGPTRIGRMFNRDHSTVSIGITRTESRCVRDQATREALRAITKRLLCGGGLA